MTRYTFDPSRLDRPDVDPDCAAGRLLRDLLGGDPFAGVRARFSADPSMGRLLDDIRQQAGRLRTVAGGSR